MKRLFSLMMTAILVFSLVSCGGAATTSTAPSAEGDKTATGEQLKVALLLPGTINDNGWNATAYNGLMMIEKNLGAEVGYSEKVPQSDQESTFREYVNQGFNVLIGHGFEFSDAAMRVAKDHPEVKFLITSTDVSQEPNLASTSTNPMQMGFLEGVVAAKMTKTNIVGGVGGMEIPPIVLAMQGFEAGVKYINPEIEVIISMTGDFDDAIKAKESANALIDKKADVIMLDADQAGLGVIEACKEKGVFAVSSIAPQHELAPDTVLGSGISDVPKAMELAVAHILAGDYTAQFYDVGITEGVVYFVPNPAFEAEYKELLAGVVKDIESGKIDVAAEVAKYYPAA